MASSSHNPFDGSIDKSNGSFDEYFDRTFENLFIDPGNREDGRKKRKERNEFISKEIVKKIIYVYGMIISVKL